jgi:hypothetical protein
MSVNLLLLNSGRGGRGGRSGRQARTPLLRIPDPANHYSELGIDLYLSAETPSVDVTATVNATDKHDTLSASLSMQSSASVGGAVVDSPDTLNAILSAPATFAVALIDRADTLVSSIAVPASVVGGVVDIADTLTASISAVTITDVNGSVIDRADRLTASIAVPVAVASVIVDRADTLNAALSITAILGLGGNLIDRTDMLAAEISAVADVAIKPSGDDVSRFKKPIIIVRPKVEAELEEALETLEDIRPSGRVSENKKKVRKALQTVKAIQAPPSYASAIANIETSLKAVSCATAKHQGMVNSLMVVAMKMQNLIAEMQRERARRQQRDNEALLWLI